MVLRHRQQEGFFEQELLMQLIVVDRLREHGRVEAAFAELLQHDLGLLLDEQEFESRKTLADLRHDMRQQVRPERRKDAEPDGAGFRILGAPRDLADLLDFVQHFARALRDLATDFGEQHLARRALDERDAELFLELADLRRQRRLADEARGRGAAEMLVFGQRNQISEVSQVHRRSN